MTRAMALACLILAAAWAGSAQAAGRADREEIRRIVVQEALRSERVPPSLALAVAEAESSFDADAESSAGARGVMQIMPATGRGEFGVEPDALWQPRLNVQLGIAFLDQLIGRYGGRWDLALSHYNGGSRVGRGTSARVIPATRAYVDKVLRLEQRNARDEAVRLMVAAAEEGSARFAGIERLPAVSAPPGRLPGRAVAAARWAAAERAARDWRPAERRRRFLALAERALDGAETRLDRRGGGADAILAGIEDQKQRFRALLAALRGG